MTHKTIACVLLALLAACASESAPPSDSGSDSGIDPGIDAGTDALPVDAGEPQPAAPYTLTAFDKVRINSRQSQANFQNAFATVDFRDGPFQKVTLIADLGTTCYPFDKWQTNPPPAGQNWPADCDAFDRNYEFHLDPPTDGQGGPAIELVRAITPFGGPMHIEQDITDVANARPGVHKLRVHITTYSDAAGKVSGSNGGWDVTARIEVVPGTPPRKVLAVIPVFDGNVKVAAGPGERTVTIPEGTVRTRIEYRATGHGGGQTDDPDCMGPAEEFCYRTHELLVDGKPLGERFPLWRNDCSDNCTVATYAPFGDMRYCLQNPCGAMGSVRAPRANWCPSTVTPPKLWDPTVLATPGAHTLSWNVSNITGGGTWRTSVVLFAYGK